MVLEGGHFDSVRQSSQQALADLAGAPVRFLAPGGDDRRFYLLGQLVGIAEGPARAIAQPFQSALLVTLKNLVAGLARNAEFPAQGGHTLPILEPDHKTHTFVYHRTFLPWHPTSAPLQGKKCNPCLRYVLLPMSRNGHSASAPRRFIIRLFRRGHP